MQQEAAKVSRQTALGARSNITGRYLESSSTSDPRHTAEMSLLPTAEAPFGVLQPINDHIVANATVLTWTNWLMMFIVPLVPMSLICYLVQLSDTRHWRAPLGLLGAAMVARGVFTYRFGGQSRLFCSLCSTDNQTSSSMRSTTASASPAYT